MNELPLLIEFVAGTSLYRERDLAQSLPIVHNGPPGAFVVFPDGFRVSLPTDQIVYSDVEHVGRIRRRQRLGGPLNCYARPA